MGDFTLRFLILSLSLLAANLYAAGPAPRSDIPFETWLRHMNRVAGIPEPLSKSETISASNQLFTYFSQRKYMSLSTEGDDALIYATEKLLEFFTPSTHPTLRRHALQGLLLLYSREAPGQQRRLPETFVPTVFEVAKDPAARLCEMARQLLTTALEPAMSRALLADVPPLKKKKIVKAKAAQHISNRSVDLNFWFSAMEQLLVDRADAAKAQKNETVMADLREVARSGTHLGYMDKPFSTEDREARIARAIEILQMDSEIARELGVVTLGMLLHKGHRGDFPVPADLYGRLQPYLSAEGSFGEAARRARKRIFGKIKRVRADRLFLAHPNASACPAECGGIANFRFGKKRWTRPRGLPMRNAQTSWSVSRNY